MGGGGDTEFVAILFFSEPTKSSDEELTIAVSYQLIFVYTHLTHPHSFSPFPPPPLSLSLTLLLQCLYECISILDILCSLSSSLLHGVFPTMRKLFTRYSSDPPLHGRLLLALVRFFLHHGQSEMYDIETAIRVYFGQVITARFNE